MSKKKLYYMNKIKDSIPIGAEIYKLENVVDEGKLKIYYKDHFSDVYNSSFKKYTTIDGNYDLDVISEELIGYIRPTKDYLERPEKIKKLTGFETLQEAKDFLKCYKLLGDEQITSELMDYNFKAKQIILDEGTFREKYKYIIHDYVEKEIKYDREYLFNMEIRLINDEVTVKDFLFNIKMFDMKVDTYNQINKENGFMNFPLYWIKNPIVKAMVGEIPPNLSNILGDNNA